MSRMTLTIEQTQTRNPKAAMDKNITATELIRFQIHFHDNWTNEVK